MKEKPVHRFYLALVLFASSAAALVIGLALSSFRRVAGGKATGFGVVLGSPAENLWRLLIAILLAVVSYWLAGKLIHH
jgi:hypothetical protein